MVKLFAPLIRIPNIEVIINERSRVLTGKGASL